MKNFMTPIKKAARASAGTPEIARGLAIRTRHTKNSQRTAFGKSLDVTPVKGAQSSPGKRKSPSKLSPKDSPAKMAKSDRIRMKKKAVATLATLEKRSRKKSLFSDEPGESLHPKKVKFSNDVDVVVMDANVCSCNLSDCSTCNPTKPALDIAMATNLEAQQGESSIENFHSMVINNSCSALKIAESTESIITFTEEVPVHETTFVENETLLKNKELSITINKSNERNKQENSFKNTNTINLKKSEAYEIIIIDDENNNKTTTGLGDAKQIATDSQIYYEGVNVSEISTPSSSIYSNISEITILDERSNSVFYGNLHSDIISQQCQDKMSDGINNLPITKDYDTNKTNTSSQFMPENENETQSSSTTNVKLSKPIHVKCKDFPIRASTCIVPKPPPPYSLIKAMRQLEHAQFESPASKSCNHSICYHSTSCCCHSSVSCNNSSISCSIRCSIDHCCHGDGSVASTNNNNDFHRSVEGNANRGSLDNGNLGSLDNGNRGSLDNDNPGSLHNGSRGSLDNGSQGSVDNSNQGSLDNGNQGSLYKGNQGSVDNSNQGSLDNGSQESVDNSNQGSLDNSNQGSLDNGSQESVDNSNQGSLDNGSQESVDNSNQGSLDNGNQGSLYKGNQGSLENGKNQGSLDNVNVRTNGTEGKTLNLPPTIMSTYMH